MKKLVLFVFLCYNSFFLAAQSPQLFFRHVELSNVSRSHRTTCFMEDANGFIWIGLGNKLIRYDAHESIEIKGITEEGLKLKFADGIFAIVENSLQRIWITSKKGIFIYIRIHSTLGYKTINGFEAEMYNQNVAT